MAEEEEEEEEGERLAEYKAEQALLLAVVYREYWVVTVSDSTSG